jgi:PAS domain S-box-containing protein
MSHDRESIPSLAPRFPLTALLVEDNPVDSELCIEFLSGAQFDLTADRARTPEEFVEKLQIANYDVVLADYHLGPAWTGMDAFDILQEQGRDVPFILVTAALGEDTAVECMNRGIADYVLKDRMERLPVAIYRALEQRAARNERRRAERSLAHAEMKFRALAEFMPAAVFLEQGTRCSYVNRSAEALTGFPRGELLNRSFWQLVPEQLRPEVYAQLHRAQSEDMPVRCRAQIVTKSGAERWLDCTVKVIQIDGGFAELITAVPAPRPADHPVAPQYSVAPRGLVPAGSPYHRTVPVLAGRKQLVARTEVQLARAVTRFV